MNAVQHGTPGLWAKVRGTVLSLWPLFLCFVALGAFGSALAFGRNVLLFASLFVVTLVATAIFWRKGLRRVESFFKGADGEERVAELLAALPGDYHVFHDFAAGTDHVDHVVAGPSGIFSVETKNWRASVTVEDDELLVGGKLPGRLPLVQARREAAAVKSALKRAGWDAGAVMPVVCFASDTFVDARRKVGTVMVLNAGEAVAWILEQPKVLSAGEVERVTQLMETCV